MNKSHKIKFLSVLILSIFILTWTFQIAVLHMEPLLDQLTQPFVPLFEHTIVYTFFANITVLGSKSWLIPFVIIRSEEHTSELQSRFDLVCRLLLEEKK